MDRWEPAPTAHAPLAALVSPATDAAGLRFLALSGHEAIGAPFEWTVEAVSPRDDLDADRLLGEPVAVSLEMPGTTPLPSGVVAPRRWFHGHVAAVARAGVHSRFARYLLTLRPWLWFLGRNADCRIFQEMSTPEIVRAVFEDWPEIARFESRLAERYAVRRYAVQYRESDLAFVCRLMEEDGIAFHFEHAESGHTLVLTDGPGARRAMPGYETIACSTGDGWTLRESECVTQWDVRREVRAGRVAFADHDFKRPRQPIGATHADPRAHALGDIASFDAPGRFFNDATEGPAGEGGTLGEARARIAMERLEAEHFGIAGEATARGIAAGHRFTLAGHPRADRNEAVLVTRAEHLLRVAPPESQRPEAALPAYRVRFDALPTSKPYRPPLRTPRPTMPGPQSAVVVGPPGTELHTDAFGRVKLAFHWDRNMRGDRKPGSGGAPLPDADRTCWVRVAQPWAGRQWGANFLPRVGQEVLVDFLDGDPDRPVVTGRLHNGEQTPVAFTATGALPGNQAIAGLRSKEIGGQRYNELLFDDTAGAIRAKLSSEHASSQLHLGYVTHPRDGARADPRGEGFELRTDAWGAVRAAKGLFLSADGRAHAVGGLLDRHELVACLEEALQLAKSLAGLASEQNAGTADVAAQERLAEAAKSWGAGSNAESAGGSAGDGGQPIVGVSGPAGVAVASPQGVTVTGGAHVDVVARRNVQLSSGLRTHLHAGTGMTFFSHSGGIRSVAHRGPQVVQAQDDDVALDAAKNVAVTANAGHVVVQASDHVLLVEKGGAYIKLAGGNVEIGGPGELRVRTARYTFTGPAHGKVELGRATGANVGRRYRFVDPASGQPIEGASFEVSNDAGKVLSGDTSASGETGLRESDGYEAHTIRFRFPEDE
jgi:type VI secretion system secreted protein VgrG